MANFKLKIFFIVLILMGFICFPLVILAFSKPSKSATTPSSGRARSTTRNRRATPRSTSRSTVVNPPPIARDPWNVDPAPRPQPGPLDTPPRPRGSETPANPAPYIQPRNFNADPVPQPNRNIAPPTVLRSFPVGTRPVVSPERISASYVKPVASPEQSREVTPGTSVFSLIFKGIKNFDKIPEKHRNHLALVLTPEELSNPAYKATLDAEIARGTVLILQIDSELRQLIVGDPEFYAQYLTSSVMEFAGFPGKKIEYWILPEGYNANNSTIEHSHYIQQQDVKFVKPSRTVTSSSVLNEFENAVLVDISGDDAEAVIENLDVQLENCGQTNYPLCDFTNNWNDPEVVDGSIGIDAFRGTLHNYLNSYDPEINLYVSRNNLFRDSFNSLKVNDFSYFKSPRFRINFNRENGSDAGGLRAEWFNLMSRELFKPETGLFLASATNQSIYYPDPQSFKKQEYLLLYKFAGCFIARCIIDQIPIGVHLSQSMYKRILGLKPDFKDLKEIDEDLHRTLSQIAEMTEGLQDLELAFEINVKDPEGTVALKPNGGDEMLSDENKDEYIGLYTNYKLIFEAEQQVEAFMSGFNYMIPAENIVGKLSIADLDALIAGAGEIDVEDWKRNIEYHGYDANSPQIIWFWELVDELTDAERRQLLRLATGSTGVPAEGFAHLRSLNGPRKYGIHNTYNSIGWPAGHTCFNYFDLPEYENRELFMQMMRDAIKDENMTFTTA